MEYKVKEYVDGWSGQYSSIAEALAARDEIYNAADKGMLDFEPEVHIWVEVTKDMIPLLDSFDKATGEN